MAQKTNSKDEKKWYIGIDFGTSNTYIAAYEAQKGNLYTNHTGGFAETRYSYSTEPVPMTDILLNIPTVITEKKKDEILVGQAALAHPFLRLFGGLKNAARQIIPANGKFGKEVIYCEYPYEQCDLETSIQFGNRDYNLIETVKSLLIEFFKKVLHINVGDKYNITKKTVEKICIGYPAFSGDGCNDVKYEDTLKNILTECFTGNKNDLNFKEKIKTLKEPELAGLTYLFTGESQQKGNVLVVDIGGGTTDFAVISRDGEKFQTDSISQEPCNIGGNTIDEKIFEKLPKDVPKSKAACREAKEELFVNSDKSDNISPLTTDQLQELSRMGNIKIPNVKEKYFLYYANSKGSDYNTKINVQPIIEEVAREISKKLTGALINWQNGDTTKKVDKVFFVGGTSIITPLREKIMEAIKGYCAEGCTALTMFGNDKRTFQMDSDPSCDPIPVTCYNAVAIGACIEAYGIERLCIRPTVWLRNLYNKEAEPLKSFDRALLMRTNQEVPFAYAYDIPEYVSGILSLYKENKNEYISFSLGIDKDSLVSYSIKIGDLQKAKETGLLIVAFLDKAGGVQCRAFACHYGEEFGNDAELKLTKDL